MGDLLQTRFVSSRTCGDSPALQEHRDIPGMSHANVRGQVKQMIRAGDRKRNYRKVRVNGLARESEAPPLATAGQSG